MSTNLIIWIVAGLAVVGGGVYVATNPEIMASLTGGAAMEEREENEDGESASVGTTFAALVALGQSVECTFSHNDGAGNASNGTVYMTSGGTQIRGDFTVTQSTGGPTEAYMIRTDGYTYLWGPDMPQGIKSKVTSETELMSDDQNNAIDADTEFACQAWNVDSSKFTLPAGIEFTDFSAQIEAATGTGSVDASGSASVKAQQCAACNMLPAGSKEQCLAALAC